MQPRTSLTPKANRNVNQALLALLLFLLCVPSAWAEQPAPTQPERVAPSTGADGAASSDVAPPLPPSSSDPTQEKMRLEVEKARIEAEKARAEADKARAEADKARAEADAARLRAEQVSENSDENKEEEADEEPVDPATIHAHDGFFLRLAPGMGFGSFSASGKTEAPKGYTEVKDPGENGPTSAFGLSLGGAVAENLILHGDFWAWGTMFETHDDYRRDFTSVSLSLGLTYYFMPVNLYLSADVGHSLTVLNMWDDDEHEYEAMPGVTLGLSLGKEWWVSDNWGLGIGVRGTYGYAKNEDLTVHQGGGMIFFSATYN